MRGLKTEEDDKFIKFFNLVQLQAGKQDAVFFLDCGEGNEVETDEISGENLSGWLVPNNKAAQFEQEWKSHNGVFYSTKWDKFFCWALWKNSRGNINISFKRFE
jgi:hypothetical protein